MTADTLFSILLIVGLLAPIASIIGAVIFYLQHSNRVGRENRVPVLVYIAAITICGPIGGYLGLTYGIAKACGRPNAGNLCGFWGFFVTGPITFSATVLLVSKLASTARRTQT